MTLPRNLGSLDRALRISVGVVAVATGALFPLLQLPVFLVVPAVGLVLLITGLSGACPLYLPLRLSTRRPDTITA